MIKSVLFVCTGNTCRSPMAEFILKDALKKRGIKGVKVASAGLCADESGTINDLAKKVLKKNGVPARKFKSRQISGEMVDKFDLVLCMTQNHKNALPAMDKIKTLGEMVDMPDVGDPYGNGEAVYTLCFAQLKAETDKLVDKLWPADEAKVKN